MPLLPNPLDQRVASLENELNQVKLYIGYLATFVDSSIAYSEYLAGLNPGSMQFDEWKNQNNLPTRTVESKRYIDFFN